MDNFKVSGGISIDNGVSIDSSKSTLTTDAKTTVDTLDTTTKYADITVVISQGDTGKTVKKYNAFPYQGIASVSNYSTSEIDREQFNGPTSWATRATNFGDNIHRTVYGAGKWVAVGTNGQVRTSTDTVTWTTSGNAGNNTTYGLNYGAGIFVVGDNFGQIRTSTDAVTWVSRTSNFGNFAIKRIAYDNNTWVAAGYGGRIRTSTDGITWTTRTSNLNTGGNGTIHSIAYGDNMWVIGSEYVEMRKSTDLITWTTIASPFSTSTINGIKYGNNTWLAVSTSDGAFTSTDTITWVTASVNSTQLYGVDYNDGLWVIAKYYPPAIFTSDDLILWTSRIIPSTGSLTSLYYGNNTWTAVGYAGTFLAASHINESAPIDATVFFDTDLTWVTASSTQSANFRAAVYGNGIYAALERNSYGFWTSTDFINWTTQSNPLGDQTPTSVIYANNTWVIAGYSARMKTSTDAVTWVTRTPSMSAKINSVNYQNNIWIATGYLEVSTSTDAITWVTRTPNMNVNITDSAYGNGKWAICGYNGEIRTSTDTVTWVTVQSPYASYGTRLDAVAYGNNSWVVVGYGAIATSTDAVTWVSIGVPNNDHIRGVDYSGGLWITAGYYGRINTSTDAVTWNFGARTVNNTHLYRVWSDSTNDFTLIGGYSGIRKETYTERMTQVNVQVPAAYLDNSETTVFTKKELYS